VRTFKQAYQKKLKEMRRQGGIQECVTSTPPDKRGRPPLLLDLDQHKNRHRKSIRNRGGIVNFKASALAVIKSDPAKDFWAQFLKARLD